MHKLNTTTNSPGILIHTLAIYWWMRNVRVLWK